MNENDSGLRYRQALDTSMDGMALLDGEGRYIYVNASHASVYGFASPDDLIGRSWRTLYDEEQLRFIDEQVFPVLQREGTWRGRALGRRHDGTLFPQELSLAFLPDGGLVCVVRDLSDQVRAEELSRISERIIEHTSSVVFRCSPAPRWPVLYVSSNVTTWGYTPQDLLSGKLSFDDIIHPDDLQRILGESTHYYASDLMRWNEQYRIVTADHSTRYVEDETIVVRNPDGSVQYVESILHDVTHRVLGEQAQHLYLLLSENTQDIMLFLAQDGSIREANKAACTAYGYSHKELLKLNILDLRAPETRSAAAAQFARAMEQAALFETTHIRKDGTSFPVEVSLNGADYNGEPVVISLIRDITERHAREAQISRLGRLVDESSDEIYIFDNTTFAFVQVNQRAQQNLGYSLEELKSMKPVDVAPEMTAERLASILQPVRDGARRMAIVHTPVRRRDGTTYPVEARLSIVETSGTTNIVVIATDITERLAAEAERTRILTAMDEVSEGIVLLDEDERFVYANQGLGNIMGFDAQTILGKSVSDMPTGPEFEELYRRVRRTVMSEGPWNGTVATTRLDGTKLTLRVSVRPIRELQGQAPAYCAVIHDATDELRHEEELRQSQKMEAIGLLAGGIAHDFNNLLTGIMGYADLLATSLPPGTPDAEAVGIIRETALKAADLTRSLLGFARKGKLGDSPVDVHTVIRDVHSLLERTLPRNIRIRKELQANPPTVMGDATQLQQVLLNLCINARDAMPDGGTLTIRTRNVLLNEPFCTSHPGTAAGWYLQAEVEDTGCGIPSLTMQHLFEPFFTTKAVGKGTGMGLATAYGIVHNHGGCIDVQSEEGIGSAFRVYLPLATNAKAPVKPIELPPVRGYGHILVVDDEDVVRQVSVDILRRLGYEVEECSSGDDAVQWYAARPAELRPDLIVMDLSMPGMDGIQALTALKGIDPGIRAVLSTGFGLEGRLSEATMAGFTGWIQKPFHPYELSVAVAQALAPL